MFKKSMQTLEFWKLMQKHYYSFGKPMQSILFVEEERRGRKFGGWGGEENRDGKRERTQIASNKRTNCYIHKVKGILHSKSSPPPNDCQQFPLSENQCWATASSGSCSSFFLFFLFFFKRATTTTSFIRTSSTVSFTKITPHDLLLLLPLLLEYNPRKISLWQKQFC